MAKVIITHQSPITFNKQLQTPCFYEAMINELVAHGNDVLHFITGDILASDFQSDNKAYSKRIENEVFSAVKEFKPDLIIAFNNSFVHGVEKIVDCPYVIWDVDSLDYFSDLDNIKKNQDRYTYFSISDYGVKDYINKINPNPKSIFKILGATGVVAKPEMPNCNISFIGSSFNICRRLNELMTYFPDQFKELMSLYEKDDIVGLKRKIQDIYGYQAISLSSFKYINVQQNRMQIMSLLTSLGIKIYGNVGWQRLGAAFVDVVRSYDSSIVYSVGHNQDIYNKSKIGISISHPQAITGYPWRITDIMASNAALVSDVKSGFFMDFGKKLPFMTYDNPVDAYLICKRLLTESNLREDIVHASQEVINKGHRWSHRFLQMREAVGVDLMNKKKAGSYKRFVPERSSAEKSFETLTQALAKTYVNMYENKQKPSRRSLKKKVLDFLNIKQAPIPIQKPILVAGDIKNIPSFKSKLKVFIKEMLGFWTHYKTKAYYNQINIDRPLYDPNKAVSKSTNDNLGKI